MEETVESLKQFIKQKLDEAGAEKAILGLSGGIDSATTLKLTVESLGSEKVTALILPGEPTREENLEDGRELAKDLNVEYKVLDIEELVQETVDLLDEQVDKKAVGNVRARQRMVLLYLEANRENGLVLGTGNRTERLLGYFTKYGDGAVDISPIADLYKTEVRKLARELDLDEKFIEKAPTAGLWKGQTDEGELGAPYEDIDPVLKDLTEKDLSVEEAAENTDLDKETVKDIYNLWRKSEHKREPIPFPERSEII